jgi:hypothetical protein
VKLSLSRASARDDGNIYGRVLRRLGAEAAVTVAATLLMVPHGVSMRTQNFVEPLIAGVNSAGELAPTGFEKFNTSP